MAKYKPSPEDLSDVVSELRLDFDIPECWLLRKIWLLMQNIVLVLIIEKDEKALFVEI